MCIASRGVVSVTRVVFSLARLYGVDKVWFPLVVDASVYVLVQSAASLFRIQITCRCTKLSSTHPGRSWFVSHIGWAVLLPSARSTSDVVQRRRDLDWLEVRVAVRPRAEVLEGEWTILERYCGSWEADYSLVMPISCLEGRFNVLRLPMLSR